MLRRRHWGMGSSRGSPLAISPVATKPISGSARGGEVADDHHVMSPEQRLLDLRRLIVERGGVRIIDLAIEFGVSEMTIRRDLAELEALGAARRVRGGAVALGPEPFVQRHRHNAKAKARIAEKLLPLLPVTGTVALDASSTIHRLARSLEGGRDLTMVTNGVDTFQALTGKPGIAATLTGGTEEPRTGSLVGAMAGPRGALVPVRPVDLLGRRSGPRRRLV